MAGLSGPTIKAGHVVLAQQDDFSVWVRHAPSCWIDMGPWEASWARLVLGKIVGFRVGYQAAGFLYMYTRPYVRLLVTCTPCERPQETHQRGRRPSLAPSS